MDRASWTGSAQILISNRDTCITLSTSVFEIFIKKNTFFLPLLAAADFVIQKSLQKFWGELICTLIIIMDASPKNEKF